MVSNHAQSLSWIGDELAADQFVKLIVIDLLYLGVEHSDHDVYHARNFGDQIGIAHVLLIFQEHLCL